MAIYTVSSLNFSCINFPLIIGCNPITFFLLIVYPLMWHFGSLDQFLHMINMNMVTYYKMITITHIEKILVFQFLFLSYY